MVKTGTQSRKPDFFIAGVPKAGTTALRILLMSYDWIYMPSPEEPNYFCEDINTMVHGRNEQWYLRKYFPAISHQYALIGEKSTWYMCSKIAASRIAMFQPEAKLIIMLRNPVDLVCSFYREMRYQGLENAPDFETAWRLQDERKRGTSLPSNCKFPKLLQYRDIGRLGDQLERFVKNFAKDRLFVRTMEDLRYGESFVKDLEEFLGVPRSGLRSIPRANESKMARYSWLDQYLAPPDWANKAGIRVKDTLGVRRLGIGLALRWIRESFNTRVIPRPALSSEMREELSDNFSPQVEKLGVLTGREFPLWTRPGDCSDPFKT